MVLGEEKLSAETADYEPLDVAQLFFEQQMSSAVNFLGNLGEVSVFSNGSPAKDSENDDSAAVIPVEGLGIVLAVADGAGGHRAGALASEIAINQIYHAVHSAPADGVDLREAILNGIEKANQEVLALGSGAATTLAVVEIAGDVIRPYHVGDSFILVSGGKGKVKLHTIAHSPVGYAVEAGYLDENEALFHEERHLVSNLIGSTDMRIEVGSAISLDPRDTVLLGSDGLADNLLLEEMVEHVRKGDLAEVSSKLAEQALKRMISANGEQPSKPDDLTFVLFRPKG